MGFGVGWMLHDICCSVSLSPLNLLGFYKNLDCYLLFFVVLKKKKTLMRRVDSLEKTLMLGGIGGTRKRGRQRMR